jgi:hypothetical protein
VWWEILALLVFERWKYALAKPKVLKYAAGFSLCTTGYIYIKGCIIPTLSLDKQLFNFCLLEL